MYGQRAGKGMEAMGARLDFTPRSGRIVIKSGSWGRNLVLEAGPGHSQSGKECPLWTEGVRVGGGEKGPHQETPPLAGF
jgi:hypothetical protein